VEKGISRRGLAKKIDNSKNVLKTPPQTGYQGDREKRKRGGKIRSRPGPNEVGPRGDPQDCAGKTLHKKKKVAEVRQGIG